MRDPLTDQARWTWRGERHDWYDARTCTCGEPLKHNLAEHRREVMRRLVGPRR